MQQRLDTPIYSKVDLNASGKVRFFNVAGPSPIASIDASNQIDKDASFITHLIQLNAFTTNKAPWTTADVALLANMIASTFVLFQKNGQEKVWQCSTTSILSFPMALPAANAAVFDLTPSVTGQKKLNEPIIIPGGQSLNVNLQWDGATDFTGLSLEMVLWGILDRTKAKL